MKLKDHAYSSTDFVDCFMVPPAFVIQAAHDIRDAVIAYKGGSIAKAKQLMGKADSDSMTVYQAQVNKTKLERAKVFKASNKPEKLAKTETRMPNKTQQMRIFERDQWHCRFCSNPVIHKDVVKRLSKLDIGARWGSKNIEKHRGISPFVAVADHLVVHSLGGTNDDSNLVTACGPCNYSRGSLTLEQVGILNPLKRDPVVSIVGWDGLVGLRFPF